MIPGQVILLNGVSRSGNSSIARQLLVDLDQPYFHWGRHQRGKCRGPVGSDQGVSRSAVD
ncbi:hypothetical protein ACIA8C_23625 [Nocardia sp. NPDC051321]|uniref:phosphotransferase-like protein n=1 Tax=Nocardia sp. NPDC051321 TaxID=3364323 RepID=UPI003789E9EF